MNKELDFLAVGDTVVDAFIKLKEAHVTCKVNHEACELCMAFGAKVPYESVTVIPAVGNSANAAVSAARLGLQSGLITFLGNDVNGRECKFQLEQENIDTEYVVMENGKMTNYHYVLWFGDERTILIKHETFKTFLPPIGKAPKWIYLSSLGEHAKDLHFELAHYLSVNPGTQLAFQPGTFQIKMGKELLAPIYSRTNFFCCNVEEAMLILGTDVRDLPTLLLGISLLGPKVTCITDGKDGSYMRYKDENYFLPIYPDPMPPLERTGAGDAFASTFAAAIVSGVDPVEALRWGPINSMNVVQYIGAQKGLLKKKDIENLLSQAPADYVVKKL
jgi:sugar/nucleoside kinase (ribokinase family)